MIHIGGPNTNQIELEQLSQAIPLPPKGAGKYWRGVSHREVVFSVLEEMRTRQWKLMTSKLAVSNDRLDLFGAFELSIPDLVMPEGQTLSLGIISSNAMRRRLRFVVGSNVLICSNGMVTGEIVLSKKHTMNLNLYEELEGSLDDYLERAKRIPLLVEKLRERELSPVESEHILMEAGRAKLMPWHRIGKVDEEYRQPTFAEHGKGTSWALLNAFTYVVKENPVHLQMDHINRFRASLPTFTVAV